MPALEEPRKITLRKESQVLELPYLIELQRNSYDWFIREGMREVFAEISPIEDFTGNLRLEFDNYSFGEPAYSIEECRDRDMTYALPLKVRVRLIIRGEGGLKDAKENEIFMGDFPYMTPKGTFVINGAERVVVSQLVRSPGVYFQRTQDTVGRKLLQATIIPNRGAWLEIETDAQGGLGVRIDKARKLPVTVLLKALGYEETQILQLFESDPVILKSLEKDGVKTKQEALVEIYKKLRPGDPPTPESGQNLLNNLFFDHKRYHMAKVGRYKLAKKLGMKIPCQVCGTLYESGVTECREPECRAVLEYRQVLDKEDILKVVQYLVKLNRGEGNIDDIDHLGNRRIRAVGELLQNQFRVGLLRLERVVRERMSVLDLETASAQALINIRPVVASIKEFFGSSQLSQFMDQTNSLAELTHKRRLSALGPGGLSRERAGFEVRDVHYSHYGRICPIETPEGPNIGLIGSLATYGRVNDFGFIMTPYRKVVKGRVTSEIIYLCADEESAHVIAQANTPVDPDNNITVDRAVVRKGEKHDTEVVPKNEVDLMDVSPKQIVSVATAMIPFLENDDANRALMGANMQRQAVPLIKAEAPLVGTGMEYRAAKDSGALVVADESGTATSVSANSIMVQNSNGKKKHYQLLKFKRSNAGTCVNQRPAIRKNDRVEAGQVIADGASSMKGEMALGKNVLVAFMPWEGYNYEDAILISEELVRDDVFTSIHIEEYECEARDTKLGPEEITRDIPNVGEEALKNLDENGVIRIGADVVPEDILVGKVTPKGETELTAEERLLRAIFGEKARDVRDTSLKVPHGEKGKVIDVKVFSRANNDELAPGVNQLVRVYIAQKRKVLQGDKMAGRHGNKGVISKVLPIEDMPYLPDGTPIQIVLNPLGVPSRMNIGQVLETHLGLAVKKLGLRVDCPVFENAGEDKIKFLMKLARFREMLLEKGIRLSGDDIEEILVDKPVGQKLRDFFNEKNIEVAWEDITRIIGELDPVGALKKYLKDRKITSRDNEAKDALAQMNMEQKLLRTLERNKIIKSEAEIRELKNYFEKFENMNEDGKTVLFDGRTGRPFDSRVMVGQIYMMKLAHLVDDKIHARSTGPYSLITQQPLGGKAQFGGQRFGEMEVWALEAYGAAYTLQELLTVKSDDVVGRVKTYEAIVKGENVMEPGVPESFKVLIKELQSLCLDVKVLSKDQEEIDMKVVEDDNVKDTAKELGLDIGDMAPLVL
ncbi:MAG: DNA-directed RNA polymerase subunit beta [bacterium]